MNDLDINILVQTFNEKIASLMTELIVKEASIKQLTAKNKSLDAAVLELSLKNESLVNSLNPESSKSGKKQQDIKQSDNFE